MSPISSAVRDPNPYPGLPWRNLLFAVTCLQLTSVPLTDRRVQKSERCSQCQLTLQIWSWSLPKVCHVWVEDNGQYRPDVDNLT